MSDTKNETQPKDAEGVQSTTLLDTFYMKDLLKVARDTEMPDGKYVGIGICMAMGSKEMLIEELRYIAEAMEKGWRYEGRKRGRSRAQIVYSNV